jgi:hypothetical protein
MERSKFFLGVVFRWRFSQRCQILEHTLSILCERKEEKRGKRGMAKEEEERKKRKLERGGAKPEQGENERHL